MVDRKMPQHGMSSVKEFQVVLEYIKRHDVALLQSPPMNQDLKLKKAVFKIMIAKRKRKIVNQNKG